MKAHALLTHVFQDATCRMDGFRFPVLTGGDGDGLSGLVRIPVFEAQLKLVAARSFY